MPLGLLLVSRGILTAAQLSVTLEYRASENLNLGEAAQRLGFVSPEQVTAAVASQWSCPVFSLAGRSLPQGVHLPRTLLDRFEMLPVHFVAADRRLTIGFVSRVEYHVLAAIERIIRCEAVPCFVTTPEYRHAIEQLTSAQRENELLFDRPANAAEIARMSRNYARQLGAREVRFGMCQDIFWIRIWNARHETDLVFRVLPG